tara:strand:+ start:747 stop:935 length:189 start_codon:yes stop_codon:yes gene_type:complete
MKEFAQFIADAEWGSQNVWLAEQKRKRKKELEMRMSDAYQKKQRQKKIEALSKDSKLWSGLN